MERRKVGIASIIFRFFHRFQHDDVVGLAAQLAYFILLSLFPLLIFFISIVPFLPFTETDILNVLRDFAPEQSVRLIEGNLAEILDHHNGKIITLGIIGTLWSASNGIHSVVKGLNRAYNVVENRPFWKARWTSIMLTVGMIVVFIIALILPVFGKQIGVLIAASFNNSKEFIDMWNAFRWGISSLIMFFVFLGLYVIAPNKRVLFSEAMPGAVIATIGFAFVSLAFSYYVSNFGNFSITYGSIGGIIALLIWFYLSALVIIIGGEVNALCEEIKKR